MDGIAEREKFERWVTKERIGYDLSRYRTAPYGYCYAATCDAWRGWKAALAAQEQKDITQ